MRNRRSCVDLKEGGNKVESTGVGLGLRMQANKRVMLMSCHDHHELSHELSSSSCGSGGGSGGIGAPGPMVYSSTSNRGSSSSSTYFGDINDVVRGVSASGFGSTDAITVSKSSQCQYFPFSSDSSLFTFSSLGEMTPSLDVNLRVPFTAAQWQELERQTMIYKYMMASVPVPPELLLPINKNQSNVPPLQYNSSLELGISSYKSDPEPWRCKRTDGKKWRCSRNVTPDQKYCERHSHKSRPRSRKHVELHTYDSMDTTNNNEYTANSLNQKPYFPSSQRYCNLSRFHHAMASSVTAHDQPRSLEWTLKDETFPVGGNSSQEWHNLKRDSFKNNDKVYNSQHQNRGEGQVSSNSFRNLRCGHSLQGQRRLDDDCSLLLSPESTTSEGALNPSQTHPQETRHFIDAWATSGRDNIGGIGNKSCVTSREKSLPLSALTLSMSRSGSEPTINEEIKNYAQVGNLCLVGSDKDHQNVCGLRTQLMSHGGSWMTSPPGGPLGEALCLGISSNGKTASDFSCPYSSGI